MSRLDSLGLLLKDIYPCKLVLFFPSFADIKPPFNLQAGFDIRCIHLFNILCYSPFKPMIEKGKLRHYMFHLYRRYRVFRTKMVFFPIRCKPSFPKGKRLATPKCHSARWRPGAFPPRRSTTESPR